ncbi:MAG: nucleotidyltransferase family protein [Paraglaciecola sp.]|uniref:nucleotidyltransferase domain-containing protein n=1 Tax=Paraglaciecola sp. TaxID=1920173 RepID=UPI00273DD098|nr:nucleotidyltransferase family protein [Paraglaciecola sp.]MDP5031005.1 nucleotidyltransferase family protein [Paraglaciecola sp.]MDP5132740.1 nucleotidyltransferase family protein [Paraglaciecola sp.]
MISHYTSCLISLLKGHIPKGLNERDWECLIRIARRASILPRLASQIVGQNYPCFVEKHLNSAIKQACLQKQQVRYEAIQLVKLLETVSDSHLLFLKGAAYCLGDYQVGIGRIFSDIDLLVAKNDLSKIETKLLVYGWFPESSDEYDQKYYREWAHEIPPIRHAQRGTLLDVHHNLVPIISGRAPNIALFTEDLIYLENGIKVLSVHAMTLHSAIHLFFQEEYHHAFRDICDLHCMFSEFGKTPTFWEDIQTLALKSGFSLELALACRYSEAIFNTPIPADVLRNSKEYLPNKPFLLIYDWLYLKVLQPHHPLAQVRFLGLANFLALLRGHFIKMPLHILLLHSFTKIYRNITTFLFGEGLTKKS